jgi:hypothetical protein
MALGHNRVCAIVQGGRDTLFAPSDAGSLAPLRSKPNRAVRFRGTIMLPEEARSCFPQASQSRCGTDHSSPPLSSAPSWPGRKRKVTEAHSDGGDTWILGYLDTAAIIQPGPTDFFPAVIKTEFSSF